jgi:carboxymethylenebutenolidase
MRYSTSFTTTIAFAMVAILSAADYCVAQTRPTQSKPPSAATAAAVLHDSPRHGEWVDVPLSGSDVKIHSFVVYPERSDKAPVVIVIHEIFGLTDWARSVADQLAAEGFIAVAPDLLSGLGPDGGGTDSFKGDTMRAAFGKLKADEVAKRLDAVRDWALAQPSAAADKSATIGFCWGGGASFAYAAHQPKLNAAVVFYGSPPTKEAMEKIACPVWGFYGKNDNRITSTVEPTTATMAELKKQFQPHVYDGAGHGFLRQQDGQDGANQKAADAAWPETIEFLKQQLQ